MNESIAQALRQDSANRYCADCNCRLVDPNDTFASFLPLKFYIDERWTRRNWINCKHGKNFVQLHEKFAPNGAIPSTKCVKTATKALSDFIESCRKNRVSLKSVAHGVYICKTCAGIHCRLDSSITKVKSVSEPLSWSEEEYEEMLSRGNAHTNSVLEKFMPAEWVAKKRKHFENKLEREVFIRYKYEILDFILPTKRNEGIKKCYMRKKTATKKWKKLAAQTERDVDWAIYTLAYRDYKDRKDTKKLKIAQVPIEVTQDVMRQLNLPAEDLVRQLKLPTSKRKVPLEAAHDAKHLLQDARRDQISLIANVVKIQSFFRMAHTKKRILPSSNSFSLLKVLRNTIRIQSRTRSFLINKNYTKKKRLTIKLQASIRCHQHRALYSLTRILIIKIQSVVRGHITRRRIKEVMLARSVGYKRQILDLWSRTRTPLTYRTKFWMHIEQLVLTTFVSQENELIRLWGIMEIDLKNIPIQFKAKENFMMANIVYSKFLQVEQLLLSMTNDVSLNIEKFAVYDKSVQLERVQIYERLSISDDVNQIYERAGIKIDEKFKKVKLSQAVWNVSKDKNELTLSPEVSTYVFNELFPEIRKSSAIHLIMPSKKSLQRLGIKGSKLLEMSTPLPLTGDTMHFTSNFDKRMKKNLAEISRCFVTGVKHLALVGTVSKDFGTLIRKDNSLNEAKYTMLHDYVHNIMAPSS